jgi:sRNA-binding carbon storage regulator CsrA
MLVLTRRIGESIYLGDDIRLTLQDRLRHHIALAVVAPAPIAVHRAGAAPRSAPLPTGQLYYLVYLLSEERLYVGDAEVSVHFGHSTLLAHSAKRQVRIGIQAPPALTILRGELYARDRQRRGETPPAPFADWLHRASRAASTRTGA